jgi:hypothetical protein
MNFLFHAKLAKEQGREGVETLRRKGTKYFYKTKLLKNGKRFQLPPWGIEGAEFL